MSYCHRLILLCLALVTLWVFYGPSPAAVAATDTSLNRNETFPSTGHFIPHLQAGCQNSITVSTNADSGAGSLRQALTDVCSGGTVSFAAGLAGQTITLTTAELSITKTVTITNPNAANLRVSGNNAYGVFYIQAGAVVTISSLSVISGSTYSGGGIFNSGALTLNNSILRGNTTYNTGLGGGGIFNDTGATLAINNSLLDSNYSGANGGGIRNEGVLTVNNSTFNANSARIPGGAIINLNNGTMIINGSTFSGNSAPEGAGIDNFGNGIVTVTNSTFSGNQARDVGGGISNTPPYNDAKVLTLKNNTFSGNSAGFGGPSSI